MFIDTITLYHYSNNRYARQLIEEVFWDNVKARNVIKSGVSASDSTTIVIPTSEPIDITPLKDIIVKGNIDYEIDNTSQQTISQGIKHLKDNYKDVVTVNIVDEKLFGGLAHIELSCK